MLQISLNPKNIIAVDIYLENRKTRAYVGRLREVKAADSGKQEFVFEYDEPYIYAKSSLPLGPDIPITRRLHKSSFLFKSLNDRIPSSKNPSYKDYCESVGISPKERSSTILLATIGRRGPSSFVFEPVYKDEYTPEDFKMFRSKMGLTMREFSSVFDVTAATIQRIETGQTTGKDILKRMAIYDRFPEVAICEVMKNGGLLQDSKKEAALQYLKSELEITLEESRKDKLIHMKDDKNSFKQGLLGQE